MAAQKVHDFQNSMESWAGFMHEMREFYQVELDCLSESFRKEQNEYYLHTAQWTDTHPQQMLGSPSCIKRFDLHKVTIDEIKVR
jgi:protein arginine N-methyltransferase 1